MKSFFLTFMVTILSATVGSSDITDEVVSWMQEAQAQGECNAYTSFLYEDYTIAGFKGKSDGVRAEQIHLDKAIYAAKKFVELTSENDVEGKRMFLRKSGKICMNETCFPSSDYIAALFAIGGIESGINEISEKRFRVQTGCGPLAMVVSQ